MSTTNNTQFLNSNTTSSTPTPPTNRSYVRRAWDGTKWAAGKTWDRTKWTTGALIGTPISWAFGPIGEGLGSGAVRGAQKEFEKMVQPSSPLVAQLQDSLEKALLKQPPEELLQLNKLVKTAANQLKTLGTEEIELIRSSLKMLLKDECKLLKDLAPELNADGLSLFKKIGDLFKISNASPTVDVTLLESDFTDLKQFDEIFTAILDRNHGALVQAMEFLQEALLADQDGMLAQAVDVLKKKCTDEQTGLMKQVVDQLTSLLGKKDGPIDLLTTKLTVGDESTIAKAIALIQTKMLDKDGIIDQIGKRFNNEEEGIIVKALAIAKKKMDEMMTTSLAQFKEELKSNNGIMSLLRQEFSEGDNSILKRAIALLNESLFKAEDGTMAKLRRELTSEDKGILQEALKIFANKLNDEKEGVLVQTMALLKKKLNSDDGVLAEALRLLEVKLNGKDGVIDKLQHRLLNEHDGTLIQALNHVQKKINDEKEGILVKAIEQMEQRLLADNGTLDKLEKRLTEEETGILAKAIESLKKALGKKDGALDLLNTRVQAMLDDSLEVLKKKCLDEKDGLIAQMLTSLNKHLKAENGLFEMLNERLNNPKEGIIVKAMATLNSKLTEENGTLDILQKKLLDEKDGILAKAIDLLNRKLQEKGGPFDTMQKRIIDENGLIDQVINQLQERLTHPEKGILVHVKQYLMDEKTGILAQANDLIKKKLIEKDGILDIIENRLNDKEQGILIKAAGVLQEKLAKVFDHVDERLTAQAHPILSHARKKLIELRRAIVENKKTAIQKSSCELQQVLEQMTAQSALVFAKQSISKDDQLLLDQLKENLPTFYAESPPSQGGMLTVAEASLAAINRYYGSQEGIAARTGTILQETITDALDPLLSRVERMPRTMVDNLLGRPPTDGPTPAAEEGTVSQFLENGSSILKQILDKGAKAISGQAVSSFASVLIFGIEQVLSKMEVDLNHRDSFQAPRTTLQGIIASLNAVRENGNWASLYQNLKNAAQALSSLKIYVNGFRIPNSDLISNGVRTTDGAYSENINALQDAMDLAPEQPVNQDWRQLANDEKNKLIANASRFLTIKHIYEDICKLKPPNEVFYLELMKKAKDKLGKTDDDLRNLLFEELEKNKVNFLTRLYAKANYFIYNKIVKHYTKKATTIYFNEVFNYIDQHKKEHFSGLRNQVTKNFTRYLTILGGAYENVANDPRPKGTLQEMLKKELDTKDANLGFETKELYMGFAQNVIDKTIGGGLVGWVSKHLVGDPELMVKAIIDKSIGTMQDVRGYTHAMNSVIHEQLEEVLKLLRQELRGAQSQPSHEEQDFDSEMKELSNVEKNELQALVKNLFEILRKSKCQTKDELRELIRGNLLSAKVNKAVDDLFIEDVIERVTNILVAAIHSLAKRNQLEKLTYKFANLVNRSFELGETVTLQEMQEEEHQITKLGGQILRLAVNTAVEEKFDFTGKKEQDASNRYIQDLHHRSQEFFTTTDQDLQALTAMDFSSAEGKNKINKIIEQTLAYESENYDSSFQAKSSKFNSDNKDQIGKGYLGIAEQSKPLVRAVSQMKQHLTTLEDFQCVAPHLKGIKSAASTIPLKLFHPQAAPTNEELIFCENQLAILNTHLKELKKMRHYGQLAEQISDQARIFATIMIEAKKNAKMRSFAMAQAQNASQIQQIANQRKQNLSPISANSPLQKQFAMFKQQVSDHFDDTYRPRLLMTLKNIEDATVPEQVDFARQEFLSICRQALAQTTTSFDAQRSNFYLSFQKMSNAIAASHLLEPNQEETAKAGIRSAIALSQQQLLALRQWEAEYIRNIPYINFNPIDMKGMQDWASGLVFDRVGERLNGFMHFLKQEETYRYGLLNHLFLVPYLNASNKK